MAEKRAASVALVTGAPGWLGTRLVRTLARGLPDVPALAELVPRRVRCLVLPGQDRSLLQEIGGSAPSGTSVDIAEGDLTDPASLARFCEGAAGATLFHAAAVIHPTRGVRQIDRVNRLGTRRLLAAAEEAGVRRFIAVSSNSPFGFNRHPGDLFDESAPYNPYMAYGRSKMQAEEAVAEFQARGRMETVIIRPPWFYGPDQPPRQTEFFRMIRRGKAPILGRGDNKRSMAYVDNICQGLLLCEKVEQAAGGTYWIADSRPYTMNEIIDTVERLLEEEFGLEATHKRLRLPVLASSAACLADGFLQRLGFYNTKIHVLGEMSRTIACSIEKARRELGYDPKISLEEGMRRSIRWCLEKGMEV